MNVAKVLETAESKSTKHVCAQSVRQVVRQVLVNLWLKSLAEGKYRRQSVADLPQMLANRHPEGVEKGSFACRANWAVVMISLRSTNGGYPL